MASLRRSRMAELIQIAPGLWAVDFPLRLLGVHIGRRMAVVQLPDGSLQLHSPGPIDAALAARLAQLGPVSALVVPTNFHDTFVREALEIFPGVPWYAPAGFPQVYPAARPPRPFADAPDGWGAVLRWQPLAGIPKLNEHVFLHRPSRALLVADLVFNIGPEASAWTRLFFRLNGAYNALRPTRFFRAHIADRAAFRASVDEVLAWDFDRLVPSHGSILMSGARERMRRELVI